MQGICMGLTLHAGQLPEVEPWRSAAQARTLLYPDLVSTSLSLSFIRMYVFVVC